MSSNRSLKTKSASGLPTMIDVAQLAGVSAMSVSRALKRPDLVTPETRRRIEAAVKETGYVLNDLAGVLKSAGRSKLVAALFPSLQNSLFSQTIQGLADELQGNGLQLMVADSRRSRDVEDSLVRSLLVHRPTAIVLHETVHSPKTRKFLLRAGIPVVEVGDLTGKPIDSVVSFSNRNASEAMTVHLLERGFRRIAFVSLETENNVRAQHRREGYEKAMLAAGVPLRQHLVIEAEAGFSGGADALRRLLAVDPAVQAVFFAGDVHAVGALLECHRIGLPVPDRLALASFDEYDIHAQLSPRLTVVKVPRYEIGRHAAQLIVQSISGDRQARVLDLGFEIAVHESTDSKASSKLQTQSKSLSPSP